MKYNVYNNIRHSIEKRYYFPDIDESLEQVSHKIVQIDAHIPEYLAISCIPSSLRTEEHRNFIKKFNLLMNRSNLRKTLPSTWTEDFVYCDNLSLIDTGVISDNIDEKLDKFFSKLWELNIKFSLVGLGGGGSNANRIFRRAYRKYITDSYDYDKLEVHNIPRVYSQYNLLYKSEGSGAHNSYNRKFNINTKKRTLAYSGVDYHDRQIVCDNPNVIAVQVGFTDDKCIMSVNPENVGIYSGDTYGLINTHTVMLNAYKGVEIFLDWFLPLTDEEIEEYFTKSEKIAEFSVLNDKKINDNIFLPPIKKSSYIPEFINYPAEESVPLWGLLPTYLVSHTMDEVVKGLKGIDVISPIIPMFKLDDNTFERLWDDTFPLDEDNQIDYAESIFHGEFRTELMEGTLIDAIQEANYRLEKFPSNFMGIMMSLDDTTRVNILHPLTAVKVIHNIDKFEGTFKFWIYMSYESMCDEDANYLFDPQSIMGIVENIPDEEPDTENNDVDYVHTTGEILGMANTYNGKYVLGIDTYLLEGAEQVPYYGYLLGDMSYRRDARHLSTMLTGNINSSGTAVCTGDADETLFSSRYRQHMVNHQSVYFDEFTPFNVKGEIEAAIDTALDFYYEKLNLNQGADDE